MQCAYNSSVRQLVGLSCPRHLETKKGRDGFTSPTVTHRFLPCCTAAKLYNNVTSIHKLDTPCRIAQGNYNITLMPSADALSGH